MDAYKCDKCKAYFDGVSPFGGLTLSGFLRPDWHRGEIHLCPSCAKEVREWFVEWWSKSPSSSVETMSATQPDIPFVTTEKCK